MAKNKLSEIDDIFSKKQKTSTNAIKAAKSSEIDDIFSKKQKFELQSSPQDVFSTLTTTAHTISTTSSSKKKKLKKKASKAIQEKPEEGIPKIKPISENVQVVDASGSGQNPFSKEKFVQVKPKMNLEDEAFADLRNASFRIGDDNMKVYIDDDLKIGQGEGDTPLCPFDCKCCY